MSEKVRITLERAVLDLVRHHERIRRADAIRVLARQHGRKRQQIERAIASLRLRGGIVLDGKELTAGRLDVRLDTPLKVERTHDLVVRLRELLPLVNSLAAPKLATLVDQMDAEYRAYAER